MTSLMWKILERGGAQGVQFIIQVILARLLLPKDFGMIAIVMVFISLANVFVQGGLNKALVQKKDSDSKDFSSVLFVSLVMAATLYMVIFLLSPYISNFYDESRLTNVLRVLSLILFLGAFNSIQNAYVEKHMLFRKLFLSSLAAAIFSGLVGVILAYLGLGVWALVTQQILSQVVVSIVLWFTVKWRPEWSFSMTKVKILFSFGWKLLVSNLIHMLYMDLRTLIIGRMYSSSILGYYNRGENFPKIIVNNIDGSLQSVMFPTFSAHQDNKKRLKEMVRRTVVTSSFLIFPAMIGMIVIAEPLVFVLLTEKWLPAVSFLQIFSVSYMFLPIQTVNLQSISALGRSDITLRLQIYKKVVGIVILIISIPFGVHAIAIGAAISAFMSMLINIYPNIKLLDYSYREQFKDVIPTLIISVIMGVVVYPLRFLLLDEILTIMLQVTLGIFIYLILALIIKLDSFKYITDIIKGMLSRKRG